MEQFLFVDDERIPSSFKSYLMLCRWYYLRSEETMKKTKSFVENAVGKFKVDDIYVIDQEESTYKIGIRGHFLDNNDRPGAKELCSKIEETILPNDAKKIIQYFIVMKGLCIKKNFRFEDQEYRLIVDTPLSDKGPACKFQRIRIQNYDKEDVYYYDLSTGVLYVKTDDKLKYLSPKTQEDILSKLPDITYREIDNYLREAASDRLDPVFVTTSRVIIGKKLGRFDKLRYGKKNIVIGYLGTLPDIDEKTQENGISFTEILVSSGSASELNSEALSRKDNIKSLLLKLKDQEFDRKDFEKIRISEELFFSSITPSKKEIDEFFRDPKIMELCDLSKIDFTNADIAGFSFEGTGAEIQLSKVYGKSIKDSNLRGINLYGQDLDGIIADGADLRDTGVLVSIEKTSIVGTKFSTMSKFMNGIAKIDFETAKTLGISIEETLEKEAKLHL